MTAWHDTLGKLTGEEIFTLTCKLTEGILSSSAAMHGRKVGWRKRQAICEMQEDLASLQLDVIAQAARITIPLLEAQGIVWRARYARGHIVRVVPQD